MAGPLCWDSGQEPSKVALLNMALVSRSKIAFPCRLCRPSARGILQSIILTFPRSFNFVSFPHSPATPGIKQWIRLWCVILGLILFHLDTASQRFYGAVNKWQTVRSGEDRQSLWQVWYFLYDGRLSCVFSHRPTAVLRAVLPSLLLKSESKCLLSRYKFSRKFVLRCTGKIERN